MAYSVLIALKSLEQRQSIASFIDWKKLDLELIASSGDGIIASSLIRIMKPDIVITELNLIGVYLLLRECPIYYTTIFGEGEREANEVEKAFGLGIYKYQQKPIIKEKIYYQLLESKKELDKEREKQLTRLYNMEPTIKIQDYCDNLTILSAISFIKQNYNKSVGLQEAAAVINISPEHLSRLFKKETGLNYVKYLNIYRINQSINLMYEKRLSLNQICQSCGFPTHSYFAKTFKKYLHVSPSKYREAYIFYKEV